MNWERDLGQWSLPELSRRIDRPPHRWHVQEAGDGPTVLLLPGAGSSVHTWRDLIPSLAESAHVVALDLPGHGFTASPAGPHSGLDEMAAAIVDLAAAERWRPVLIVGHSAGAAIALRMSQMTMVPRIIGINPALDNFQGVAGWLFPLLARLLAVNPLTARLFTLGASEARARRLIEGTGSHLSDEGYWYYQKLTADRDHVNGALNMMARWSLQKLISDLPGINSKCLFLIGDQDSAVPPRVGENAAKRMPRAKARVFEGLGHLLHEEDPQQLTELILEFMQEPLGRD